MVLDNVTLRVLKKGEMFVKAVTTFEKQLLTERQDRIAKMRCKICNCVIGNKPYRVFEERYFHLVCLKNESKTTT
jgi:hypothetical protein